jgi:hypothetical protein
MAARFPGLRVRMQTALICMVAAQPEVDSVAAPIGGSRVKNSEMLLAKRDLPRPGGRNNRIPAILAGYRSGLGATADR